MQESGTFKLSKYSGEIPARLDVSVRIDFTPGTPTNFYQRVFVLIEHAMPLFFDVMGTGYISPRGEVKEQRPAPLRHAHVQAFRNRVAAGYERLSPMELEDVLEREGLSNLFALKGPEGTAMLEPSRVERPVTRSGETTRNSVAVALEFMRNPGSAENPVYLSTDQVRVPRMGKENAEPVPCSAAELRVRWGGQQRGGAAHSDSEERDARESDGAVGSARVQRV
jgi:hypothetical protein